MVYKCLKCGSINVIPKIPKGIEVEAVIPVDAQDEGNIGYGETEKEGNTIPICEDCGNFGSPFDKGKFSIVQ